MAGAGRRKARPPRKILRLTNDDGSSLLHSQMQEIDSVGRETGAFHYEEGDNGYVSRDSPVNGFSNSNSRMVNDIPPSPTSDMENSPPKLVDFGFERSPPRLEMYLDNPNSPPPRSYYRTEFTTDRNQHFSHVHHPKKDLGYANDRLDRLPDPKYYNDYTNYRANESLDHLNNPKYKETPPLKPSEDLAKRRERSSYKHQHPEPTPEFPYQCETCDMLFKAMELLLDHQKTVHENNRQFACRYCLKKFNDKYNMRKHVLIHVGEKRHKCKFCEKAFLRKDHLRSHLQTHYNKKYGCRFCGRSFRTRELYQRHLGQHREEAKNNPELAIPEIREDGLTKESLDNINKSNKHSSVSLLFSSKFKDQSLSPVPRYENQLGHQEDRFTLKQPNFSSHRLPSPSSFNSFPYPFPDRSRGVSPHSIIQEEENVSVTILDDDFNLCNQFSPTEDLNENSRVESSNTSPNSHNFQENNSIYKDSHKTLTGFQCQSCPKVFSAMEDLNVHSELCQSEFFRQQSEANAEKFQCSKCKVVFSSSSLLQEHYKKVHSIERRVESPSRWRCKTCNINYPNSKALSRHYALAHKDAQLFPCSECPKTFTVWHNLKKHMLIHLGDKKHKCTICEKGFVRKDHLNSHLKVHQNDSARFTCSVCSKVFRQKVLFNKHMTTHHNAVGGGDEKFEGNNKFNFDVNSMRENDRIIEVPVLKSEKESSPGYLMAENSAVQQFIENGHPNRYPLIKDEERISDFERNEQ